MSGTRELKVYVSEGLGTSLDAELQLCGCTMSGFVRTCIAKELVRRSADRKRSNRALQQLPGQQTIGDDVKQWS
jgi:hypothetical protein